MQKASNVLWSGNILLISSRRLEVDIGQVLFPLSCCNLQIWVRMLNFGSRALAQISLVSVSMDFCVVAIQFNIMSAPRLYG